MTLNDVLVFVVSFALLYTWVCVVDFGIGWLMAHDERAEDVSR